MSFLDSVVSRLRPGDPSLWFDFVVWRVVVGIGVHVLVVELGHQEIRVSGPCSIFLEPRCTNPIFEGDRV